MGYLQLDLSAFIRMVEGIRRELPQVISETLDTLATIAVTNAKSSRRFKNQTGNLRSSIQFIRNGELTRQIIADTPYAGYVEFGNRPGGTGDKIYPKKAKALRFVLNGQVVFRRWVRSHGPLPFMQPARDLAASFLPDLVQAELSRLVQRHSQG